MRHILCYSMGLLTLPIACDSILPTLIRMQRRGILWPGTVNASYRIVLTMLHHRPFWQAVGDNFPVEQIGELATGTTFPLYRELCNIRPHFSLAFVKVPAQDIGRRSLIWWTPLCRMLQIMTRWISLDTYDYMHHIVNDYATECMTHIKALGSGHYYNVMLVGLYAVNICMIPEWPASSSVDIKKIKCADNDATSVVGGNMQIVVICLHCILKSVSYQAWFFCHYF